MKSFRLAAVQMTSTDQVEVNLATVAHCFQQAVSAGAQLAVFPENSLFFRVQSGSGLRGPELNGPEFLQLSRLVDNASCALMLTTPLRVGNEKFINATVLLRPGHPPHLAYSKIHLFDVDVPGAPPVRESDFFEAGRETATLEIEGWKFGLSICYDLRFAELYSRYSQNVDVILIPSAFLVPTGQAHWHVLVRARAIENQCFVAAPAQSGEHVSGSHSRHTYGHSLVVDPWGRVLAELSGSPEVKVVELNPEVLAKVREQIPMERHRRL